MTDDELLVERLPHGVVLLTLNRPSKRNAFTPTMFERFAEVCDEVQANSADRVLVVTGAGDSFSSGADIAGVQPGAAGAKVTGESRRDRAVARARVISEPALALHRLRKPAIAAVNGLAAGAGCSFAMGCDLVIASSQARFALIFVRRALGLDLGATWLLPRLVGPQRAKQLAFTGDWMSAADAMTAGLVLEVQPDVAATLERALTLAEQIARMPPLAVSVIKRGIDLASEMDFAAMIEHECQEQADCSLSPEYREAIAAFREKREPQF